MQLVIFVSIFDAPYMCRKVRCDGKSWKFLKFLGTKQPPILFEVTNGLVKGSSVKQKLDEGERELCRSSLVPRCMSCGPDLSPALFAASNGFSTHLTSMITNMFAVVRGWDWAAIATNHVKLSMISCQIVNDVLIERNMICCTIGYMIWESTYWQQYVRWRV